MPVFKDANGREWTVRLDAPAIRAARAELSIDLATSDGAVFDRLAADPIALIDCLWIICREQANHRNVTDVQFAELLAGDPIEAAEACLEEAIADFFPQRKRSLLRSLSEKNAAILSARMEVLEETLADPDLVAKAKAGMEAEMKKQLIRLTSVKSLPESAELAPSD